MYLAKEIDKLEITRCLTKGRSNPAKVQSINSRQYVEHNWSSVQNTTKGSASSDVKCNQPKVLKRGFLMVHPKPRMVQS